MLDLRSILRAATDEVLVTAITLSGSHLASVNERRWHSHIETFDLMRGLAAIIVVIYHFAHHRVVPFDLPHADLAVDFFFVLSGFALAKSYSKQLKSNALSVWRFTLMRIVRLWPVILLGTSIALCVEPFRPNIVNSRQHLQDTAIAYGMGLLLVPTLWKTTLEHTVFPLNTPVWSLFFELVINFVYAFLCQVRAYRRVAICLLLVSLALEGWAILARNNGGAVPQDF